MYESSDRLVKNVKTYRLECSMSVPVSLREAFAFFENPHNLARITPPWLNFRVTSPERIQMRKGAEIDYQIRWLGLPLKWKTLSRSTSRRSSSWTSRARVPMPTGITGTISSPREYGALVSDCVDYALPFGPLGRLAHRLTVRKQLQQIFDYRQNALSGILTGATAAK